MRCLGSSEVICYRINDLRLATGIVVKNIGKSIFRILDISYLNAHNRNIDQIQFQEPYYTELTSNTQSDRHTMNLRRSTI